MNEFNRFSEHYRIDQYLRRKKTSVGAKSKSFNFDGNLLSNFPVGLIVIGEDPFKYEESIEYINKYACKLFQIKENPNIKELKEKLNEFIKLKNNSTKTNKTLKDIIFNYPSFNMELENFVPFQSTYSKSVILYIKINEVDSEKYIVIDKYDKYIEERRYIELNLIKTINYQYLHTLYHELNNPLNALLAIAGECNKAYSSEVTNSRFEPSIIPKKSVKLNKNIYSSTTVNYNKKTLGLVSLSNNKLGLSPEFLDCKSRKKTIVENGDLNNKIPLLVNIIKIFIKNFILYLKTRADNLAMLKNEFDMKNETSDIMNVVEVSEYEKELTKHKSVKINLEYIFSLYLEKFLCLFKYKEIECETNFEKLKNLYVVTDEFNFIYYIRQIYTYLYYMVPKKGGFVFEYIEEGDTIKIIVKRKTDLNAYGPYESTLKENKNNKDDQNDMSRIIQTKEMTKEVLYSMSKKLNFLLEICDIDCADSNNNIYLSITIPFQRKDKTEEDDEFKDEDINEMIQKDAMELEDKLKRNLPIYDNCEHKYSNNNLSELISKAGKDNSENSIYIKKDKNLKLYSNNNLITRHSDNNLKNINKSNEKPKIIISTAKTKNTFLNKCLKITENNKNIYHHHRNRSDNFLKVNTVKPKARKHISDKSILYKDYSQKNDNENTSQKLSGVFTKINNLGLSQELNYNEINISKRTEAIKNKKNNNLNINKDNQIKDSINTLINLDINSRTKDSTYFKSSMQEFKNSKLKNSYLITDSLERENNNINININNNNIINIINENCSQRNKSASRLNINKKEKRTYLGLTNQQNYISNASSNNYQFNEKKNKRISQNISPIIKCRECMTFFIDEKKENVSKEKKTVLNESINENEDLFIEAKKERQLYLEYIENKNIDNKNIDNKNININVISNSQFEEEEESEVGEDINGNDNDNNILEEKEEEEENNCNCVDILVVDDEEFNIMASKKMIKNLGFESEAAYNGQECIDLIKKKQKLNCSCNRNYYKLIFLDIVMPVLDGIKTAKKIQEMIDNKEINENINIIFISGNIDGNELKESLLKINCVKECLQKPVRIDKYQKIFEKYYKDN